MINYIIKDANNIQITLKYFFEIDDYLKDFKKKDLEMLSEYNSRKFNEVYKNVLTNDYILKYKDSTAIVVDKEIAMKYLITNKLVVFLKNENSLFTVLYIDYKEIAELTKRHDLKQIYPQNKKKPTFTKFFLLPDGRIMGLLSKNSAELFPDLKSAKDYYEKIGDGDLFSD